MDKQVTHIRKHLSFPPLATLCPSGLQSTAYTWSDGNQSALLAGGVTPASQTPQLHQAAHLISVARQINGQFPCFGIPDLEGAVAAAAHQQAAVG